MEARTHNGEVFDSKLELAAHRWLTDHGILFERQVEIELQPGFEFAGKKIRKISYFADFKIARPPASQNFPENLGEKSAEISEKFGSENPAQHDDPPAGSAGEEKFRENFGKISEKFPEKNPYLWVDMKGMETPEFKLKWKLLLFKGIYVNKVRSVTELVSLLQKLGFWQNQT